MAYKSCGCLEGEACDHLFVRVTGQFPEISHIVSPGNRTATGVGDVGSAEKGSGARYNGGKPDVSLLPLWLLAERVVSGYTGQQHIYCDILVALGEFQMTGSIEPLHRVLDILGPTWWQDCARVFSYGAKKYAAWNWAKGMAWSIPLACAARHTLKVIQDNQMADDESGLPHAGHIACNVIMLLQYQHTYPEGNGLPAGGLL